MTPTPYLFFRGACREAMTFYAETLGGRITQLMSCSDVPPGEFDVPTGKADWIMHSAIEFDRGQLMGADDIMGGTPDMQGVSVAVSLPTVEEGGRVFDALADGGEVHLKYGRTFWSPGFGMLRDRFGIRWMVTTDELPD
ncbi:MAG: VOC family protein [Rhodobacteraceae bacterium]|nr:VOC family protein [Paracoccaceae bacterium]